MVEWKSWIKNLIESYPIKNKNEVIEGIYTFYNTIKLLNPDYDKTVSVSSLSGGTKHSIEFLDKNKVSLGSINLVANDLKDICLEFSVGGKKLGISCTDEGVAQSYVDTPVGEECHQIVNIEYLSKVIADWYNKIHTELYRTLKAELISALDSQIKANIASIPNFTSIIAIWSGAVNTIPAGWHLCDGSYGTPDLRNRFVVGAGAFYNPGNTGYPSGTTNISVPGSSSGSSGSGGSGSTYNTVRAVHVPSSLLSLAMAEHTCNVGDIVKGSELHSSYTNYSTEDYTLSGSEGGTWKCISTSTIKQEYSSDNGKPHRVIKQWSKGTFERVVETITAVHKPSANWQNGMDHKCNVGDVVDGSELYSSYTNTRYSGYSLSKAGASGTWKCTDPSHIGTTYTGSDGVTWAEINRWEEGTFEKVSGGSSGSGSTDVNVSISTNVEYYALCYIMRL